MALMTRTNGLSASSAPSAADPQFQNLLSKSALWSDSSSRTLLPEGGAGRYTLIPSSRVAASLQGQAAALHAQGPAVRGLCSIDPRHRKRSGSLFPERQQ